MRLNKVEPTALLSPTDDTINGVKTIAQVNALPSRRLPPWQACILPPGLQQQGWGGTAGAQMGRCGTEVLNISVMPSNLCGMFSRSQLQSI